MILARGPERPFVIGHRGAPAVAPENTLASLEAAVAAGADLVELDVQPDLHLGHSPAERPAAAASLDAALELLAARGVGAHLDLKLPGYEREVLELVHRRGLDDRVLFSTTWLDTLRALERLAPELPRAVGYPRDRHGVSRLPWPPGTGPAAAAAARSLMPARIALLLRRTRATVLALHHTLCSPGTVRVAHARGVPVLAWTANTPAVVLRVAGLGVDAVVSDDPGMALATLNGR